MMVVFVLKQMKQLILRERSHDRASRSESTDILHSAATWRLESEFQDASQPATRGATVHLLTKRKSNKKFVTSKTRVEGRKSKIDDFAYLRLALGFPKMV